MSGKYKVGESAIAHFVTFSVVGWIDVFSREQYKQLFADSLQYCQQQAGLQFSIVCAIAGVWLYADK